MKIDLRHQLAVVTGAGRGIGFGVARELARAGADVIVADIREDAEAAVKTLVDAGLSASFARVDVSEPSDVARLGAAVRDRGALNILVNNAGIAYFNGIADTEPRDWDRVIGVDLKGVYLMTRAMLPMLRQGAPSSVVNIASVHANLTVANMTAYAAAKGAVVAMVRSLAQELGPHRIRVNAISPGFVDTPLYRGWRDAEPDPAAAEARVQSFLPLRRISTPDEIGYATAFLCSEFAGSITGTNLVIDSGLTTRLMH